MVIQKPTFLVVLKQEGATGTHGDERKAWEELQER